MAIDLPIRLSLEGPLDPVPASPYCQCGNCHYVGSDVIAGRACPCCTKQLGGCSPWPDSTVPGCSPIELWHEEVFCWNQRKAELATVVAAFHFEASLFHLFYYGTVWLDPDLNRIGARFDEVKDRNEKIWRFLDTLVTRRQINAAAKHLFGADCKSMLSTVLGDDFRGFWREYSRCREWRNLFAHRGRRILYETVPRHMQRDAEQEQDRMLRASLVFVPTCWVVFSKLWNEYIHKSMLARKRDARN
jgi:hypothetical protein